MTFTVLSPVEDNEVELLVVYDTWNVQHWLTTFGGKISQRFISCRVLKGLNIVPQPSYAGRGHKTSVHILSIVWIRSTTRHATP